MSCDRPQEVAQASSALFEPSPYRSPAAWSPIAAQQKTDGRVILMPLRCRGVVAWFEDPVPPELRYSDASSETLVLSPKTIIAPLPWACA